MTRYVDSECYAYVDRQKTEVASAFNSITSEYGSIIFSNAVEKIDMDGYVEDIKKEMSSYYKSLSDATFSPTNF